MQQGSSSRTGDLRRRARRVWLAYGLAVLVAAALSGFAAVDYGRSSARAALEEQGLVEANLKVALLSALLERPRSLPLLLSQDRDIIEALETGSAASIDRLNRKLEGLVKDTQASVLYAIRTGGVALASSNWQEPDSFVGKDYRFRDYYGKAIAAGSAEQFALGSVSKRPGLYISRRVGPAENPLGVVVVKVEFDQLEREWQSTGRPAYLADSRHVVLISSIPSWQFMTTEPLPDERLAAIRDSLQFGNAPLRPLPFETVGAEGGQTASRLDAVLPGSVGRSRFLRLVLPVPTTGWTFEYLLPEQPALSEAVRQAVMTDLAVLASLAMLAAGLLWWRQAAALKLAEAADARDELERRVTERTDALSRARDLLQAEIGEHRNTTQALQGVQQELVAANRLAILGQVAAGVAHEINQPVATIRAYADNARTFLERGKTGSATANLELIAALTERIGSITDELRAFARKGRSAPEPVALRAAVEGAVLLLRSRFAGRMEALTIDLPAEEIRVTGNRIRLEQVFINLFQNALEALEDGPDALVRVAAERQGEQVFVRVSDNGPGIDAEILGALFTPFNTSKERGLGLGLVISKEILADYGAAIEVESSPAGTTFTLCLRSA